MIGFLTFNQLSNNIVYVQVKYKFKLALPNKLGSFMPAYLGNYLKSARDGDASSFFVIIVIQNYGILDVLLCWFHSVEIRMKRWDERRAGGCRVKCIPNSLTSLINATRIFMILHKFTRGQKFHSFMLNIFAWRRPLQFQISLLLYADLLSTTRNEEWKE